MRKMKLSVENLSVQSFVTSTPGAGRGTVVAHANPSNGPNCGSAYDACQTGLCTFDARTASEACPSALAGNAAQRADTRSCNCRCRSVNPKSMPLSNA